MTLTIRPATVPYESVYQNLIANITPGSQFLKAPIVLPYTENLTTSFIIEGNVGDVVEIFINNRLQTRRTLTLAQAEFNLQLVTGRNFIQVKTRYEDYLLLVAATNYATFLRVWAQQFYYYAQVKVDDAQRQLNSRFSLRAVEHQLIFQDLLPPTRVLRTLAGKMAVRSLINETGSTRGVNDIATAISNTTPVVVPTQISLEKFEPAVYTLYDRSHDFGGHEFHLWIPNIAAATWSAFIKLANNLDDDIIKLTSVSDTKVSFDYFGQPETHIFDFEDVGNDIVGIITRILDCFFSISVSIEQTCLADLAFCAWTRFGVLVVDVPLGIHSLDVGGTLDAGNLLDSTDEADPLTDGWLGTDFSLPLDSGFPLDTIPSTSLFDDLNCFFEPVTSLLGSSMLDISIEIPVHVTASILVDNSDSGWVLGEKQLNIDTQP
jgi:hypothetical protein